MSLVQLNRDPSTRQLRQFGLTACMAIPAIGWFWSGGNVMTVSTCAAAGLVLAAIGWFKPTTLKPLFVGLSLVTLPIGMVVSEVMLALLYYGVFVPMGMVFRLMRRDALLLRPQEVGTWWQDKPQPTGAADYFKQWSHSR